MSWHCSPAREEDFSLPSYLDGIRSERLKSISTPDLSCLPDNVTECSDHFPSGMMSAPSTDGLGEDWSISSQADFPAQTSHGLGMEKDSQGSRVDYGGSSSASSARACLNACSPRTSEISESGVWTVFGIPCEPSDITPETSPCLDQTSAPRIHESELGCSPGEIGNQSSLPETVNPVTAARNQSVRIAESIIQSALAQGRIQKMTDGQYEKKIGELLPTLTAQDAKNNGGPAQYRRNTLPLNALLGGPLNPEWCEWLMGWPIGWTDSEPLETGRYQQWLQQHSVFSARA